MDRQMNAVAREARCFRKQFWISGITWAPETFVNCHEVCTQLVALSPTRLIQRALQELRVFCHFAVTMSQSLGPSISSYFTSFPLIMSP